MHAPLLPESVHELHDVERLGMRHLPWFQQSFCQCFAAGDELVLVACDLLGHMNGFYISAVGPIDGYGLRIVDIVNDEIAIGTGNDTDVVAHALCR